jgi:hypothetical protein
LRSRLDDLGAGEVALEAQDVVHLGAAPAVDRLVVVADAADVLPLLGQQPQPQVLGDVGVLVLVDQQIAEPVVVLGQHVRLAGEDGDVVQQQVAEVAGVQHPQAFLVETIKGLAALVGEVRAFGGRQAVGRPAAVLPLVDQAGQHLGRPTLGVDVLGFQQLLEQPLLIVVVEDGVVRLQPDQLGMAAQDLGGHRVEGAQPAQALGLGADDVGDPLAHLARGLVGEGDASSSHGLARPVDRMCASRVVSTRVLPVPAPARTSTGPSVVSTASRCSGFRPSR